MFAEDLDVFFDTDDFAQAATLQGGAVVNVIFNVSGNNVLGVSGNNPMALCKSAAVVQADVGKTLTINSVGYTIIDRELRGDGAYCALHLRA